MSHRPTDFGLWLRDELYAEATGGPDAPPRFSRPIRSVELSELEAVAFLLLTLEWQASPKADRSTLDIAHHLTSILLARLV